MNEPRKIALTLLVVLGIGLLALAVEWFREKLSGWLVLLIVSVVLLLMALSIHPIWAHDHQQPGLNDWLAGLHAKNKTWCCNGSDTDAIEDWETKGNRYRVKFRGQWFDVPEESVVDGPNKASDALLWMNKGYSGVSVRCFMPGSMT